MTEVNRMSLNQSQRVYEYNDTHRPKFNEELFVRHDDDIINALKNIILSIQRDSTFTIKVTDFEVIDIDVPFLPLAPVFPIILTEYDVVGSPLV